AQRELEGLPTDRRLYLRPLMIGRAGGVQPQRVVDRERLAVGRFGAGADDQVGRAEGDRDGRWPRGRRIGTATGDERGDQNDERQRDTNHEVPRTGPAWNDDLLSVA